LKWSIRTRTRSKKFNPKWRPGFGRAFISNRFVALKRWLGDEIITTNQGEKRMANVNVRPLVDRVLVQAVEEKEVKKGGIIIPDTAKEKPQEAKVIAIGSGKLDDSGKKIPFEVKKGDKVLVSKYGGT
jgi:chaperonin GroES